MKKLIFYFLLAFFPLLASGSESIKGNTYNLCINHPPLGQMDYYVEFMKNNEEFEGEIYLSSSKEACGGKMLFVIGRIATYDINGNELISTTKEVKVLLFERRLIPYFNRMKFCDLENWAVEKMVPCHGRNIFDQELLIGHRSISEFKLKNNNLFIMDDKDKPIVLKPSKVLREKSAAPREPLAPLSAAISWQACVAEVVV